MAAPSGDAAPSISPHRDAVAAGLLSYYKLLAELPYLPQDVIATPPEPDGWPEEDRAKFRRLGKSDAAVDLLCHIPYLTSRDFEVNYETLPIDWRSDRVYSFLEQYGALNLTGLEPAGQKLPSNVVSLTEGFNYGRYILLDVDTGMATDYSLLGGPDPMVPEEIWSTGLGWTKYETRPFVELIADWAEKLRSLYWIAIPGRTPYRFKIRPPTGHEDLDQEEARQIYRDHGWGTDNFRAEECRAAMIAWDEEEVRG